MITLEKIRHGYHGRLPVLDGLDFTMAAGDKIGLAGPNGSGKTTLLHIIMGLIVPQGGALTLFGEPMEGEEDFRRARRRMGFVFQNADDQLFCPTVAEDIAFGPRNLGKSADEAHDILHKVLDLLEIDHLERRVTHQLSGGEKRLVALATVLAMEPEVLILDEPTTGLDPETEGRLVEILDRVAPTLLVVTHDADFMARTTRTRLRLAGGRLHPSD